MENFQGDFSLLLYQRGSESCSRGSETLVCSRSHARSLDTKNRFRPYGLPTPATGRSDPPIGPQPRHFVRKRNGLNVEVDCDPINDPAFMLRQS